MFGAESYGLDDDEPEAWPEVSQQKLDEALRCAICGDLFTMPVSLATCTHTYCSLCIRRCLEFGTECPTCRAPGSSDDLRPNHTLEAVVSAFKAARGNLLAGARRRHDPSPVLASTGAGTGMGAGTAKRKRKQGGADIPQSPQAAEAHSPRCAATSQHATRRTTRQSVPGPKVVAGGAPEGRKASSRVGAAGGASTSGARQVLERPSRSRRRTSSEKEEVVEEEEEEEEEEAGGRDTGEEKDDDYDMGEDDEEEGDPLSESDWDPNGSQQQAAAGAAASNGTGAGGNASEKRGRVQAEVVDLLDDDEDEAEDDDDAKERGGGGASGGSGSRKRAKRGGGSGSRLPERPPSAPATMPGSAAPKQRKGTVRCPICDVCVLEGLINSHVDVCLRKSGGGGGGGGGSGVDSGGSSEKQARPSAAASTPTAAEQQRPAAPSQPCTMAKLPKLVYHIMKDKKLRELLANAGLSVAGTRAAMEKRIKEFTLRVNAAIDSGHQPSLPVVAREVTKLERDRDRAGLKTAAGTSGLTGPAPTAATAATSKADTFSRLIASVKQREQSVPKPPRREGEATERPEEAAPVPDETEDEAAETPQEGAAEGMEGGADEGMEERAAEGAEADGVSDQAVTEELAGTGTEDETEDAGFTGDAADGGNDEDGKEEGDDDAAVEDSEDDDAWQKPPMSQAPHRGLAPAGSVREMQGT